MPEKAASLQNTAFWFPFLYWSGPKAGESPAYRCASQGWLIPEKATF